METDNDMTYLLIYGFVFLIFWPGMWMLVGGAGYLIAHHKQRPDKANAWGLLCLVLPMLLPLLTALRLKPLQPSPLSRFQLFLIVVANLFVIGQLISAAHVSVLSGNLYGLPTCSSYYVSERIKEGYSIFPPADASIEAAVMHLPIVGISNTQEIPEALGTIPYGHRIVLTEAERIHCTASAILSNGSRQNVNYVIHESHPSWSMGHVTRMPQIGIRLWGRDPEMWGVVAYGERVCAFGFFVGSGGVITKGCFP